jgi:hypothetical protein
MILPLTRSAHWNLRPDIARLSSQVQEARGCTSPATAVDRKRFHLRLPARAHGDGQRPGWLRGVPQTGRRLLLVQGLRASILRGMHREVRASVPELRLKAGLRRQTLTEPEILEANPAGGGSRSPPDCRRGGSGLLH